MNKIEQFLEELALPFEKAGEDTWVVQPRTTVNTRIAIRVDDSVVTFSANVAPFAGEAGPGSAFDALMYQQLLVWNATEMLHAAYGISGDHVVLSGALEFENLDLNEFRGMVDDISLGVDSHFATIRSWTGMVAA